MGSASTPRHAWSREVKPGIAALVGRSHDAEPWGRSGCPLPCWVFGGGVFRASDYGSEGTNPSNTCGLRVRCSSHHRRDTRIKSPLVVNTPVPTDVRRCQSLATTLRLEVCCSRPDAGTPGLYAPSPTATRSPATPGVGALVQFNGFSRQQSSGSENPVVQRLAGVSGKPNSHNNDGGLRPPALKNSGACGNRERALKCTKQKPAGFTDESAAQAKEGDK